MHVNELIRLIPHFLVVDCGPIRMIRPALSSLLTRLI